ASTWYSQIKIKIVDSLVYLTCTMCLQVFEEPIALPCGHSFCLCCVENCWENKQKATCHACPNCHEIFPQKPQLKKNLTLASLVDMIKLSRSEDADMRCEPKCTEHGDSFHFYCEDDESLICSMCMAGQHQDHKVVALEFQHHDFIHFRSKWYLEWKRRAMYEAVDKNVNQIKRLLHERLEAKLSHLQQQSQKFQMKMDYLREAESTLKITLQELKVTSFLQVGFTGEIGLNIKTLPISLEQYFIRFINGRSLRLDPNSAHPQIKIAEDLRTATLTRIKHPYPEHPDRFDCWIQVLSIESFSSGRHYWEVDVGLCRMCRIGVALNSMMRKGKGKENRLGENPKSWCVQKWFNGYSARHNNKCIPLSVLGNISRFGFFLDCEEGELKCFGDSRVLHVFKGNFREPIKPALRIDDLGMGSVRFCLL
uniref:Uncharacterized protein n=1 Tax=Eptatretus burgeri TaxID=7764 RepID=A0A8C4R282_EPTBU